mgnify:CR=1 FL=1
MRCCIAGRTRSSVRQLPLETALSTLTRARLRAGFALANRSGSEAETEGDQSCRGIELEKELDAAVSEIVSDAGCDGWGTFAGDYWTHAHAPT